MSLHNKKPNLPASEMHALLQRLVDSTKNLAASTGLSHDHTRFLYAALLASVITADDKIRAEELILYAQMVTQRLHLPEGALDVMADLVTHGLNAKELAGTTAALRVELAIEKRVELIAMLWELALCDDELHPREEERVEKIAEMIGVSGLRAMAEKMNAVAGSARVAGCLPGGDGNKLA